MGNIGTSTQHGIQPDGYSLEKTGNIIQLKDYDTSTSGDTVISGGNAGDITYGTSDVVKIETKTISNATTASITFSSLGTYKGYILVGGGTSTSASGVLDIRLNADSGANYARSVIQNSTSTVTGGNATGATSYSPYLSTSIGASQRYFLKAEIIIPSTTMIKMIKSTLNVNQIATNEASGFWANTSDDITSISVYYNAGNSSLYFGNGDTFILYGVR